MLNWLSKLELRERWFSRLMFVIAILLTFMPDAWRAIKLSGNVHLAEPKGQSSFLVLGLAMPWIAVRASTAIKSVLAMSVGSVVVLLTIALVDRTSQLYFLNAVAACGIGVLSGIISLSPRALLSHALDRAASTGNRIFRAILLTLMAGSLLLLGSAGAIMIVHDSDIMLAACSVCALWGLAIGNIIRPHTTEATRQPVSHH